MDQSDAVLYYNNSDIHAKTQVSDEMGHYCKADTCLRKEILSFFEHRGVVQDRCCVVPLPPLPFIDEDVVKYRLVVPDSLVPAFIEG